jgi:hypothetical protein
LRSISFFELRGEVRSVSVEEKKLKFTRTAGKPALNRSLFFFFFFEVLQNKKMATPLQKLPPELVWDDDEPLFEVDELVGIVLVTDTPQPFLAVSSGCVLDFIFFYFFIFFNRFVLLFFFPLDPLIHTLCRDGQIRGSSGENFPVCEFAQGQSLCRIRCPKTICCYFGPSQRTGCQRRSRRMVGSRKPEQTARRAHAARSVEVIVHSSILLLLLLFFFPLRIDFGVEQIGTGGRKVRRHCQNPC